MAVEIVKEINAPPEAHLPEKVWIERMKELHFNIHQYNRNLYYRVDVHEMLEIPWITEVWIVFGLRKGFRGISIRLDKLKYGDCYNISKTHKDLARELVRVLKVRGVPIKEVVKHGKKKTS